MSPKRILFLWPASIAAIFLGCAGGDAGTHEDVDARDADAEIENAADDTESQGQSAGTELAQLCAPEQRIGGFNIFSTEGYTNISGAVANEVDPRAVPAIIEQQETCALLTLPKLFCDPACTGTGEICGADGQCVEEPLNQSVGTITVEGMNLSVSLDVRPITSDYSLKIDDPLPAYDLGASIRLSAAGDALQSFSLIATGPEQIVPLSESVAVDRDRPAVVSWTPDDDPNTQVQLKLNLNRHGTTSGWITCDVPDTGSFEIPAELINGLIDRGLSGYPEVELMRRSTDKTIIAEGCVDLTIYTLRKLEAAVAGLVSCSSDAACGEGQRCSEELVCVDKP